MIDTIKQLWKTTTEGRSSHWPALRKAWLKDHPTCAACGTKKHNEVHHVIPFSHDPTKELDPTNLLTLCEYHECHHRIGHSFDWTAANKFCREDAAIQLERIKWRVMKNVFILSPVDDV